MFRTTKRLLIPVLASVSALVIILCILFFVTSNTDGNEIVTVYCITKVKRDSPSKPLTQYTYDEKGRILEVINSKGETVEIYRYDQYGNPTLYPYPGGGNAAATYDKNGNILSLKRYYSDITKPVMENIYTYDRKGKLIETVSYSNGTPSITERYTYNKNGDVITKSREYTSNNSVPNEYIHAEYDENRNMISFKVYGDDKLWQHVTRQYDGAGRLIKYDYMIESYLKGKTETKIEYIYDYAGRLIREKIITNDSAIPEKTAPSFYSYVIDYEYDAFSNLVKQTTTYEQGEPSIIRWSYDYRGNLVSYTHSSMQMKWYYNRHGNIIKEEYIVNGNVRSTTEYTYKSFTVTKNEANFINSQQKEIILLPRTDATPKTPTADELIS